MGLIDRLKDVKAPWGRQKLDGSPAPEPATEPSPAPPVAEAEAEGDGLSIPLHFLIAGAVVLAAWLGWTVYAAADRGVDAGVGVLVAWPTLLALALVVIAPFAAIGALVVRVVRGSGEEESPEEEEEEEEDDDEGNEDEEEAEDEENEDEEADDEKDEDEEADEDETDDEAEK